MARSHLRVYYGPEIHRTEVDARPAKHQTIEVRLGEVLPLLADAVRDRRTWLNDFSHDEITISTDLYEVLLAYQHCRRPSA